MFTAGTPSPFQPFVLWYLSRFFLTCPRRGHHPHSSRLFYDILVVFLDMFTAGTQSPFQPPVVWYLNSFSWHVHGGDTIPIPAVCLWHISRFYDISSRLFMIYPRRGYNTHLSRFRISRRGEPKILQLPILGPISHSGVSIPSYSCFSNCRSPR